MKQLALFTALAVGILCLLFHEAFFDSRKVMFSNDGPLGQLVYRDRREHFTLPVMQVCGAVVLICYGVMLAAALTMEPPPEASDKTNAKAERPLLGVLLACATICGGFLGFSFMGWLGMKLFG